ncbi:MAG: hypothetical protein NTY10_00670 [Candidatus Omnitrophica bacterium]|nr:hypothetical protein [Candidatus Omnitrophota bacterium]
MRLIGIDENGYGPVLGPLVVTSTSLKLKGKNFTPVPNFWQLLEIKKDPSSNSEGLLVCDSKLVFNTSRKKEQAAEETILAFFYLYFSFLPETADQFLKALLNHSHSVLRKDTPGLSITTYNRLCFCWKKKLSLDLNRERRKHILKNAEKLRNKAKQKGVTLEKPRCLLLCPSLFNDGLKNRNKSELVLEAGLSLIKSHSGPEPFLAGLGKVGGLQYYRKQISARFGPKFTVTPTREEKNNSAYELKKSGKTAGKITYLQDGEENSFLIALSSFFGKYTRDLFWKKTRAYLEELLPSPPPHLPPHLHPLPHGERKHASGYRDHITRQFIGETEELRKKLNVPDDCFLRRK